MESLLISILLLCVAFIIIMPILTFIYILKLKNETKEQYTTLLEQIRQIKDLKDKPLETIKEPEPEIIPQEVLTTETIITETIIEDEPVIEPIPEPVFTPISVTEPVTKKIIEKPIIKPKQQKKENPLIGLFWGENMLSKAGIITFVLGIAFFVKYAIDQDWINEVGRVGIGLITGLAVLGIAHKLKRKYDTYSSILAGGGFAIFYITITLAFREYELIPQPLAFFLLILITVSCVILSLFYDKKELALFALVGGFIAPVMVSTGENNYIVLFSYILILNTGMLWLSFHRKWHMIGTACFVFTQLIFWIWLFNNFLYEYTGAFLFLLLFFIQFHILVLADHLFGNNKLTKSQIVFILCNNIFLFLGGLFIFWEYPVNFKGLITIIPAVLNGIALVCIYKKKQTNINLNYLLIATVLTFITIAIPVQLKGNVITLLWAAEVVILLVLWLRTQTDLFKKGLYIVIGLVIASYYFDIQQSYILVNKALPIILNKYTITGLGVLIAFSICYYLAKKQTQKQLTRFFYIGIFVLLFIIPFNEINHQLTYRMNLDNDSFHFVVLATFSMVYTAILLFFNRKKPQVNNKNIFSGLLVLLFLYGAFYMNLLNDLLYDIYLYEYLRPSLFMIHLISLPAVFYIIYETGRFFLAEKKKEQSWYVWVLTILSVWIITGETDNLVMMLVGNKDNFYATLHAVHTFGYPILWGILAMGLMITGLKIKDITLRKISLTFFAFIICKFYLYDVWRMTPGGRIISFVILGLILLLVSFMQHKIKGLVKENKTEETIN